MVAKHDTVKHSTKEYAREEVHTNTIENVPRFSSVVWSASISVIGEAHLHHYLAEFDFRYNRRVALNISGTERSDDLLHMAHDKRLTYRRIGEPNHA